ncbi:MAG: cytochrome c-type biogenesis protein CcmH [Moraxella sp.]|nr:cytochrome c-type biogenesis protein CcmH [Moraxella sp.]
MSTFIKKTLLLAMMSASVSMAAVTVYEFDNPKQEAQYQALIEDFRCPTCQNQNLAGSDAPIAQDLKQKTYEMVMDGRSDSEIRAYMFERYGDFISYKPPVRPSTWILWFFPPVLLLVVLVAWVYKARQKNRKTLSVAETEATKALSETEEQKLAELLARHKKEADNGGSL